MIDNFPLVSIVMPSYNQAKFLEIAILSVLNQDYPNIELIIIDGGSTDGSLEIIRKFENRIGFWISEPDLGPVDAVNKGFAKCTGDFIGLNFSDDVLCLDGVSRKVALFQSQPEIDFIYGDCEDIDENGEQLFVRYGNNNSFQDWVRTCQMPITQQSSLWKRSVLDRVGGFKIPMRVVSDWEFFLRVGLSCQIRYLPGIMGKFRAHANSQSQNLQLHWVSLVPKMYEEFFARNDIPSELKAIHQESLANAHIYTAYLLLKYSSLKETLQEIKESICIYPKIILSYNFAKLLVFCVVGSKGRTLLPVIAKNMRGYKNRIQRGANG